MVRSIAIAIALAVGTASIAVANEWASFAYISDTMGVSANRLCIGEATRGAIGCPATAPSVTTAGDVSVTGNLSANRFLGDGSGLTGVVASSGDRIASGTTSMVAVSSSGFVSLTQAGVNTGWFDPARGLVTLGVSSTGPISATGAFINGTVGVGTESPSSTVDIASGNWNTYFLRVGRVGQGGTIGFRRGGDGVVNGSIGPSSASANDLGISYGSSGGNVFISSFAASPSINFLTSNTERMRITGAGSVGIGMQSPTATLQVSGTFIVSNTAQVTTPSLFVAANGNVGMGTNNPVAVNTRLEVAGGNILVDNSYGLWIEDTGGVQSLSYILDSGNNVAARLNHASGSFFTGLLHASGTGQYYIQTRGVNRLTVGATGNVGIGISGSSIPSDTLHVSGSTRITSWTTIAANVTPTTALDVYGTISATTIRANSFTGDGSGLTGVVASSGDRIASGTTSMVAVSSSGFVSLTQAGVNTGWFDPARGLVTLGVSATGGISGTTGYFSQNVGIGTNSVTTTMVVSGTLSTAWSGNNIQIGLNGNTSPVVSTYLSIGGPVGGERLRLGWLRGAMVSPVTSGQVVVDDNGHLHIASRGTLSSDIRFYTSGSIPFSERMRLTGDGNFGIGTTAPNSTLDVSGTARITSNTVISGTIQIAGTGNEGCTAATIGTIRLNPITNRPQICRW